jgi:hypothetical protein
MVMKLSPAARLVAAKLSVQTKMHGSGAGGIVNNNAKLPYQG